MRTSVGFAAALSRWAALAVMVAAPVAAPVVAFGVEPLSVVPIVEKRVATLPDGTLYWRIENFPSTDDARKAAGPWSLVVEVAGRVWLFTLGAAGGASPGATRVTEVGPIPRVPANAYLLRINDASGPPGSVTPVHSHPGSEAVYVLEGRHAIRGAHDTVQVDAGHAEPGHGADQAMEVSNSGSTALHSLVMFVLDADRPFSSPAQLP